MNLKATTLAVSGILFCTTLWAGEFSSQTIRLAHTAAVSHAHHEAAQLFAKNVSDRTNGKVKVEIYPFMGDRTLPGGNDHELAMALTLLADTTTIQVSGPEAVINELNLR